MEPIVSSVVYGETTLPEDMVKVGGDCEKHYPIVFGLYHIRAGEKQILIDAGCDTMPGFEMRNFISPKEALKTIGVRAEKITDVVITHAHHDHIDGVRHFPNAVIHIQEDEYQDGKAYIPDGFRVHTFQERCIVADCVEVEKVGGHSKGSCIAKLTMDGEHVVFCGDECYLRLCFEEKVPTGTSCRPEISRKFVETYASDAYRTLLSHDPEMKNGRIQFLRPKGVRYESNLG